MELVFSHNRHHTNATRSESDEKVWETKEIPQRLTLTKLKEKYQHYECISKSALDDFSIREELFQILGGARKIIWGE